jgi:hypothetical protein
MDSRQPQKPLRRGGLLAFLKPYAAGRGSHDENRDITRSSANAQAAIVQDGDAGLKGTIPAGLSDKLASELFARLLLELPEHRRDPSRLTRSGTTNNWNDPPTNCWARWSTANSRNWPARCAN